MKTDSDNKDKIVSGGTGYMPDVVIKKPGRTILYPVTKNELQAIKSSSYGDIALNTLFGCLSASLSMFVSYITCKFDNLYIEISFLYIAILLFIISVVSLIMWVHMRNKSNELYNEIMGREDAINVQRYNEKQ